MRRFTVVIVAAVSLLLVGAACGDDGGGDEDADTTEAAEETTTTEGGGDASAFCDALEPLQDVDPEAIPGQDDVDALSAAADAAPEPELADAAGDLADYGQQLVGLDAQDPEDADDLLAAAETLDDDIVEGVTALDEFTNEECGFEIPLFAEFVSGGDGAGDEADEGDVDTDAVREELEASAPEVEEMLVGFFDFNNTYTLTLVGITDADAVEACNAVSAAFAATGYEGVPVAVADEEATVFAEGESGSDCEAA